VDTKLCRSACAPQLPVKTDVRPSQRRASGMQVITIGRPREQKGGGVTEGGTRGLLSALLIRPPRALGRVGLFKDR
jgi:hypothetical protein